VLAAAQITDAQAKRVIYAAFLDGMLEAPRSLLPEVHRSLQKGDSGFDPLHLGRNELVFLPVEVDQVLLYIQSSLDLRTLLYILLR
jgi:hypothetical protein